MEAVRHLRLLRWGSCDDCLMVGLTRITEEVKCAQIWDIS